MKRTYTKKQQKELARLKLNLGITTKAEEIVLEHLYFRNGKNILIHHYGEIKEYNISGNNWVKITTRTNKASFNFNTLSSRLLDGDEQDLWQKIE